MRRVLQARRRRCRRVLAAVVSAAVVAAAVVAAAVAARLLAAFAWSVRLRRGGGLLWRCAHGWRGLIVRASGRCSARPRVRRIVVARDAVGAITVTCGLAGGCAGGSGRGGRGRRRLAGIVAAARCLGSRARPVLLGARVRLRAPPHGRFGRGRGRRSAPGGSRGRSARGGSRCASGRRGRWRRGQRCRDVPRRGSRRAGARAGLDVSGAGARGRRSPTGSDVTRGDVAMAVRQRAAAVGSREVRGREWDAYVASGDGGALAAAGRELHGHVAAAQEGRQCRRRSDCGNGQHARDQHGSCQ